MRAAAQFLMMLVLGVGALMTAADEDGWYVNGKLVPDDPSRGHDGPFLAHLALTDDAERLYEAWNTKPGGVQMPELDEALPGAQVEAIVFFARCKADASGNCQIWGLATVTMNGNVVLARDVEVPLYVDQPKPTGLNLGISEHGVGMRIEVASSYRFEIAVTDRVAHRTVNLVRDLKVGSR